MKALRLGDDHCYSSYFHLSPLSMWVLHSDPADFCLRTVEKLTIKAAVSRDKGESVFLGCTVLSTEIKLL